MLIVQLHPYVTLLLLTLVVVFVYRLALNNSDVSRTKYPAYGIYFHVLRSLGGDLIFNNGLKRIGTMQV